MSITVPGTVRVHTINGRKGPFNIGKLSTEIGEFTVKDTLIEQYEEGEYSGVFRIAYLSPNPFLAGGRVITEILAHLDGLEIEGADVGEQDEPVYEQHPLEAEQAQVPQEQVSEPAPAPETASDADQGEGDDPDRALETLFGYLWPLGDKVALDATIDRATFYQQKEYLQKTLDYSFDPRNQVWLNPEVYDKNVEGYWFNKQTGELVEDEA